MLTMVRNRLARKIAGHPLGIWVAEIKLDKFYGDWSAEEMDAGLAGKPYETIERQGNLLLNAGISALWGDLIGNGTATAGQSLTFFNNAQSQIGVGDSTTAAAATQVDLQAASNKLRKAMDATYPLHTDGTNSISYRSTFATADANFAWQEWGVFNGTVVATSSTTASRMLNRKVESLGTKTSAASWQFTVTISIT